MTDLIDGPIHRAMTTGQFPVLVSLARHDMDLAKAAVDAGAFGLKVHLNAWHRAAGVRFGTFAEERPFLEQLAKLGKPLLVMAGQETVPTAEEMRELEALGFEGFNLYLRHMQPHLLRSRLRPILAMDDGSTEEDLRHIAAVPGAMTEASIMRFEQYGTPLDDADLRRFREIVQAAGIPVIAPSQKRFVPEDMPKLRAAGISAPLIGSVVTGSTPESLQATLTPFVRAAETATLPTS